MSDMTLFQGGIPAHLQNAKLDDATKALMGEKSSTGSSLKRISIKAGVFRIDRKSTRLNSSHVKRSRMPSSA